MTVQDDRVDAFRELHVGGCFVMPNPWDAGSALALEQLGFKALATSSAGAAWTLGRADNQLLLEETLEHLRTVVGAVELPVNADFEGGFADEPEEVATNVKRAATTGIAGLSIEDSTGDVDDAPVRSSYRWCRRRSGRRVAGAVAATLHGRCRRHPRRR
jgi:2-methylisocitrate lyase-like PEP mutase family enzyme